MFFDEGLHTVQGVTLVITGKESFPSSHPVLSLLTVPVEELQGDKHNSQSVEGQRQLSVTS